MSVNQDIFDTTTSGLPSSKLIFLELHVKGGTRPLRALVDTGASSNFIRVRAVDELIDTIGQFDDLFLNGNGGSIGHSNQKRRVKGLD
jgi:hypothetical protein